MSRLVSSVPTIAPPALDGRAIAPHAAGATEDATGKDDYITKVAKYVPVEFVGGYLFFQKLVSFAPGEPHTVDFQARIITLLVLIMLLWLLIPPYFRHQGLKEGKPWLTQALVSCVAFPVWLYAIGGSLIAGLSALVPAGGLAVVLLNSTYLSAALLVLFSIVSGFFDQ